MEASTPPASEEKIKTGNKELGNKAESKSDVIPNRAVRPVRNPLFITRKIKTRKIPRN
jgi:hypothetical protein